MKKFTAILVALMLTAVASVSAFAAGINDAEKSVLDALKASVTMQGNKMTVPTAYVNQVESYFNTIEVTEDQAKVAIENVEAGVKLLEKSGASNIGTLKFEEKKQILEYGKKAVAPLGLTATYDKSANKLNITDKDGNVVFSGVPTLDKNGKPDNSNNNNGNGVIATTGAEGDFSGAMAVATVAVVLTAGCAFFVIKSKKEA